MRGVVLRVYFLLLGGDSYTPRSMVGGRVLGVSLAHVLL